MRGRRAHRRCPIRRRLRGRSCHGMASARWRRGTKDVGEGGIACSRGGRAELAICSRRPAVVAPLLRLILCHTSYTVKPSRSPRPAGPIRAILVCLLLQASVLHHYCFYSPLSDVPMAVVLRCCAGALSRCSTYKAPLSIQGAFDGSEGGYGEDMVPNMRLRGARSWSRLGLNWRISARHNQAAICHAKLLLCASFRPSTHAICVGDSEVRDH